MTSRWPCLVVALLGCASPTQAADTWYLMVPPFSSFENSPKGDGVRVLTDPPLVEWRRVGSFDSLQAC